MTRDRPELVLGSRLRPQLGYVVAVLVVGLALSLQLVFVPLIGGDPRSSPFLLFFAAVMVAAWFGGLWPGLLATVLSAVLAGYFFLFSGTQYRSSTSPKTFAGPCSSWKEA